VSAHKYFSGQIFSTADIAKLLSNNAICYILPVLWWGIGVVVCAERGANDLYMVQLMPLPPHHRLLQYNPEWFTFLVLAYPDKRPLNGRSSCFVDEIIFGHTGAYRDGTFPS